MRSIASIAALCGMVLAALGGLGYISATGARSPAAASGDGIHKIKHVIIVMQENRSFDTYFGTYPGAAGLPMKDGTPSGCVRDWADWRCVKPFHDRYDLNAGGPHSFVASKLDVSRGTMDGFITEAQTVAGTACRSQTDPNCMTITNSGPPEVMGYHTSAEIPNYWSYARNFVLQDHLFEPVSSWSWPSHLYLVSGWSAACSSAADPMSCRSEPALVRNRLNNPATASYAWTDITYLLDRHHVSWAYYAALPPPRSCAHGCTASQSSTTLQTQFTPLIWNLLPHFTTVKQDGQADNIQDTSRFYAALRSGRLPEVSWVIPSGQDSEHPPNLVSWGQTYVTGLVNAVMKSSAWRSSAIFISWDDWGGFYDHLDPPSVDGAGYGIRVPGLVISPYAKRGYIDHQTLSFDAYLKFIEDDFLNGQRLDPRTDGRPDHRPDVRENEKVLGNLINDFDFNGKRAKPLLLPLHPKADLIEPNAAQLAALANRRAGKVPAVCLRRASRIFRVTAVHGSNITARTSAGATVTVELGASTLVNGRGKNAAPAALRPGVDILVRGGRTPNGKTIVARQARVLSEQCRA